MTPEQRAAAERIAQEQSLCGPELDIFFFIAAVDVDFDNGNAKAWALLNGSTLGRGARRRVGAALDLFSLQFENGDAS